VDGHQNLPSDGQEASAMAITESHQDRRSSRCPLPAESVRLIGGSTSTGTPAQIIRFCVPSPVAGLPD
jgi:hypothetical protein